ncbi:MAG TPA: G5 domain-containing protein [Candidatus Saccharimonadales bacterium]|nr:G5 domain-containing protein [Candidatus Saccharimonadales bacterium]
MIGKFRTWYKSLPSAGLTVFWIFIAVFTLAAVQGGGSHKQHPTQQIKSESTSKQSKVETKTEAQTEPIAYTKTTTEDPNLAEGKQEVRASGKDGIRTKTYKVTYTDGKETARQMISDEVTTEPIAEVTAIGTYVAPKPVQRQTSSCDPNYSGCVPIASDVDCAGGSGNGPAYVSGPVYVTGTDIYDLDRDGDGVGCQS